MFGERVSCGRESKSGSSLFRRRLESRDVTRYVSLVLAVLLAGCFPEGRGPYQVCAIAAAGGKLATFEGRWYDYEYHQVARVTVGSSPELAIRLYPGTRLLRASMVGRDLAFYLELPSGEEWAGCLSPVDQNHVIRVALGGKPSGCGNCTPTYIRNVPRYWLAQRRFQEFAALSVRLYDLVWQRLAEVL